MFYLSVSINYIRVGVSLKAIALMFVFFYIQVGLLFHVNIKMNASANLKQIKVAYQGRYMSGRCICICFYLPISRRVIMLRCNQRTKNSLQNHFLCSMQTLQFAVKLKSWNGIAPP
jgi:hypothetical protein